MTHEEFTVPRLLRSTVPPRFQTRTVHRRAPLGPASIRKRTDRWRGCGEPGSPVRCRRGRHAVRPPWKAAQHEQLNTKSSRVCVSPTGAEGRVSKRSAHSSAHSCIGHHGQRRTRPSVRRQTNLNKTWPLHTAEYRSASRRKGIPRPATARTARRKVRCVQPAGHGEAERIMPLACAPSSR